MKKKLYNVRLNIFDSTDFFLNLEPYLEGNSCKTIAFMNAHCFNIAQKNNLYLQAVNETDILLNDGIGIKIACLIHGFKPKENMNGTDLIPQIIAHSAKKNKKVFLVGGEEGIAEKAKKKLLTISPDVEIVGTHSGFFSAKEEEQMIEEINQSGAEVIILGMGVPKQELWAAKSKNKLTNVKVIISGGAILDFLADKFKRAPKFIQIIGFEWFIRLLQEPSRLAKRYIVGNFIFLFSVIFFKIRKK